MSTAKQITDPAQHTPHITEANQMDNENKDSELRVAAAQVGKSCQYDVSCWVGADLIHQDQFPLAKAKERSRFARGMLEKLGGGVAISTTEIECELMAILNDQRCRTVNAATTTDKADVLGGADEFDVSNVVRPELILQDGLSAIAVPRMLRREGRVEGQWVLYLQRNGHRSEEILGTELRTNREDIALLSPQPSDPNASDIKNLNRWSLGSRREWLSDEPAPTTAEVLKIVEERINRYIVLPPDAADAHRKTLAAWVLMTYAYPALPAVPYLYLAGPAGSGKSRTMDVLARMVFRPMMTSNTSAATVFRTRHANGGTLLIDEAERMRDTRSPDVCEILSVLLAGYRRGGSATRMEPHGETYKATSFDCYGPVALGCIKGLPPALASRCITVKMLRASKSDPQSRRSLDDTPEQAIATRDVLHRWALGHAHRVVSADCVIGSLANRDAELWIPLLRIVSDAGDDLAFTAFLMHAERMSELAAADAQPEFDELMIRALYELRTEDMLPTAGEILERAKIIDTEALDDKWSPRGVSTILKRYFEMKRSNGRKVYRDTPAAILAIASQYSYDIEGGGK